MLVLSRQREQAIIIGDDIEVKIVDVRGDKVRAGDQRRDPWTCIARKSTTPSAARTVRPQMSSRRMSRRWSASHDRT